jgi:hypothetical protein
VIFIGRGFLLVDSEFAFAGMAAGSEIAVVGDCSCYCVSVASVDSFVCSRLGVQEMQTRCPKCTTVVRSNGASWEILNGACEELSGTEWKNNPEFCPTLSQVAKPEVVLPGVASRVIVQAEIERVRIVKVRS